MFKKILDSSICGLFSAMGAVCSFGLSILCLYLMGQLDLEHDTFSHYFCIIGAILMMVLVFITFVASALGTIFSVGVVVFPILSFFGIINSRWKGEKNDSH